MKDLTLIQFLLDRYLVTILTENFDNDPNDDDVGRECWNFDAHMSGTM